MYNTFMKIYFYFIFFFESYLTNENKINQKKFYEKNSFYIFLFFFVLIILIIFIYVYIKDKIEEKKMIPFHKNLKIKEL